MQLVLARIHLFCKRITGAVRPETPHAPEIHMFFRAQDRPEPTSQRTPIEIIGSWYLVIKIINQLNYISLHQLGEQ